MLTTLSLCMYFAAFCMSESIKGGREVGEGGRDLKRRGVLVANCKHLAVALPASDVHAEYRDASR